VRPRRHHNNKGERQVRRGRTYNQVKAMCRRLGLPFAPDKDAFLSDTPISNGNSAKAVTDQ